MDLWHFADLPISPAESTHVTQLQDELRQNRPFDSAEQEAFLNIERTAAVLLHEHAEALKPHGITPTQYNVLRILRGSSGGLCRNDVRDRLVAQVPDVTRLLDRMEVAGLIERKRNQEDRRFVTSTITEKGASILGSLDAKVRQMHRDQLGHMTNEQLSTLSELLTLARVRR